MRVKVEIQETGTVPDGTYIAVHEIDFASTDTQQFDALAVWVRDYLFRCFEEIEAHEEPF